MKTIKLTITQHYIITRSIRDTAQVLNELKRKPLEGKALSDMRTLEAGVQHLEAFVAGK